MIIASSVLCVDCRRLLFPSIVTLRCALFQDDEVTYAELVLAGRTAHNAVDVNGGGTLRRGVAAMGAMGREPTIYAQIDHSRKVTPPSLGTPLSGTLSPSGSIPPLREIVTVRTPLMASQQESCV